MKKQNKHFNHAYKAWCGKEWLWKNDDGTPNHPMDQSDEKTKAFYQGFWYAKKGQKVLQDKLTRIKYLETELKRIEKQYNAFKEL